MEPTPLVSIIIPYYHGERFITETLHSLINQNYPRLEIIVVSDGSSEESLVPVIQCAELLSQKSRDKRIIVLNQTNQGQAAARNLGITHASGSVIGMIDQDDQWPPHRLSATIAHLMTGQYDFVRGHTQELFEDSNHSWQLGPVTWYPVLVGAALYTTTTIRHIGPFDTTLREGEDFDWSTRLEEAQLREKRIPETTLWWRKHANNQSAQKDHIKNGQLQALKRKLARARTERN